MIFLTLLDEFSSCNIIYLWNFMTHLFYFKPVFWQIFRESLTCLCHVEVLNQIQVQGLMPVKASQFTIAISVA